jgi:hypothetical protein
LSSTPDTTTTRPYSVSNQPEAFIAPVHHYSTVKNTISIKQWTYAAAEITFRLFTNPLSLTVAKDLSIANQLVVAKAGKGCYSF